MKTLKIILCLVLCLCIGYHSQAQTTTDAAQLNKQAEDVVFSYPDSAFKLAARAFDIAKTNHQEKETADAAYWQGKALWLKGDYGEVYAFLNLSLGISEKINYTHGINAALNQIGATHYRQGRYPKALDYFTEALKKSEATNDIIEKAFVLSNIGNIYYSQGNYQEALRYYFVSLSLRTQVKDLAGQASSHNNIGSTYEKQAHYEKATKEYTTAIALYDKIEHKHGLATTLNNIGKVHQFLKEYDKAMYYFQASKQLRQALNDKHGLSYCYENIGNLYFEKNNADSAIYYHQKAVAVRTAILDREGLGLSFIYLAKAYLKQNNFEKANLYVEDAFKIGVEINSKSIRRDAAKYASQINSELKRYDKAFYYQEIYIDISEKMLAEEENVRLQMIKLSHDVYAEKTYLDSLVKAKKIQDIETARESAVRNVILVSVFSLLVVIVSVLYYLNTQKQQNNTMLMQKSAEIAHKNVELALQTEEITTQRDSIEKHRLQLEESNAAKDKFFSILGHDLKTPLNSFIGFSSLIVNHVEHLSKEEIRQMAMDLNKSVKSLYDLIGNLLQWSRSQTGNIEYKFEKLNFIEIAENNINLLEPSAQAKNIHLQHQQPHQLWVIADLNAVNTIIRNLLSNAIKFTPQGGKVILSYDHKDNFAEIIVRDTGVGMSQKVIENLFRIDAKHSTVGTAHETGTGLGLILCKEFVEKNGGTITVSSKEEQGTEFIFTLPLAKDNA